MPQGSFLGPQLFSVDINDIPETVKDRKSEMFADGTTSHETCENFPEVFSSIVLKQLEKYADFQIHTYIGKTETMFITNKPLIDPPVFGRTPKFSTVTGYIIMNVSGPWYRLQAFVVTTHTEKLYKQFKIKLKNL